MVHWLGLSTFTAEGAGPISGQVTEILQAAWYGKKNNNNNNLIFCCPNLDPRRF